MKESDIRPAAVLERYLAAVRRDAAALLERRSAFRRVPCVACGARRTRPAFPKQGYRYETCLCCGTLFLNPRPTPAALGEFYETGTSSKVWSTEFYPATAASRKRHIMAPRVAFLKERLGGVRGPVVDVGCGYGLFLEAVRADLPGRRALGVEPSPDLAAAASAKGLEVVTGYLSDALPRLRGTAAAVTLFEVLEHLPDPVTLLKECRAALRPGGLFWATALGCDGFDVAVLGARHKNVYPPCHINILSLEGFRRLAERAGFRTCELTTPGRLDCDIVRKTPGRPRLGPYLEELFASGDEARLASFQRHLAETGRSSHVWLLARR